MESSALSTISGIANPRPSESQPSVEVHQAIMASVEFNKDDTIWRRRLAKRLTGVRAAKASPHYATCWARPVTPDPYDRTVSKRRWEWSMQVFRRALRDQEAAPGEGAAAAAAAAEPYNIQGEGWYLQEQGHWPKPFWYAQCNCGKSLDWNPPVSFWLNGGGGAGQAGGGSP